MSYSNIHHFQVVNELLAGSAVFALDRQERELYELSSDRVTVKRLLELLRDAKRDHANRITFWMECDTDQDECEF